MPIICQHVTGIMCQFHIKCRKFKGLPLILYLKV